MTGTWKLWEGQVVDGNFPLQQYLGGSEHSGVFLTQHGAREPQKAAIKLIPADPATAALQLSRWAQAAELSHPHLLPLFHKGRCRLGNTDLLYLVMEYAEEDLSQILPRRPLTPAETRDMLGPALDALGYLHGQGFVHGHIKPANILAAGDQLKLSSDALCPIGDSRGTLRQPSAYDPPEAARGTISPAGDVWSLGMTLVEALTQRLPAWPQPEHGDPVVPETLPQPFLDIVRHALRRDPQHRWTVGEIAACLNPATSVSAVTPPSVSKPEATVPPLSVPLSPVSPRPGPQNLPVPPRPVPSRPLAPQPPVKKQRTVLPRQRSAKNRYVVPLVAAGLLLVALLGVPKLFNRRPQPVASIVSEQAKPQPPQPKPEQHPLTTTSTASQASGAGASFPAALPSEGLASEKKPKTPTGGAARGEVLDQVLPDVSQKVRATIQGKVRVTVRVHVDPSGNVAGAELEAPGPSKYFAEQALQAARRWEFQPPEADGHSIPSAWLLRFEFSQTGTKVTPVQEAP
jgi:TonB family protein